jgi:hypothetical protein
MSDEINQMTEMPQYICKSALRKIKRAKAVLIGKWNGALSIVFKHKGETILSAYLPNWPTEYTMEISDLVWYYAGDIEVTFNERNFVLREDKNKKRVQRFV